MNAAPDTTKRTPMSKTLGDAGAWLMLVMLTIAILIAAQTEPGHQAHCPYDDQVMTSSGQCLELDAIYDAARD